jgi:hypothetical protein
MYTKRDASLGYDGSLISTPAEIRTEAKKGWYGVE